MDNSRRAVLLLVLVTLARLGFAASFPPIDDEAYYWTWSRHLDWGYPDHPPAVALMIRATTALAGDGPLGLRLGPVLLALGSALLLLDLGRRLWDIRVGVLAALGYQAVPAFAVGAVLAVPDAPMSFFWLLTVWLFWQARTTGRPILWLAAGAALGLAVQSKLPAVLLGVGLAGFLAASPADRTWWSRPHPYLAAAAAAAALAPLVLWNMDHRWILLARSAHPVPWTTRGAWQDGALFAAAQLGYYGPLAAPLLVGALAWTFRRDCGRDARLALWGWAALPTLLVNAAGSLRGVPKPHWTAPVYLMALVPAAARWTDLASRRRWRRLAGLAVGANLVVVVAAHLFPLRPTPSLAGQLWGWDQVVRRIEADLAATPAEPGVFVLAPTYQVAGQLSYHGRDRFSVTTVPHRWSAWSPPAREDAFALFRPAQAFVDSNAVVVNDANTGIGLPLHRLFRRVERLPDVTVVYRGVIVRRFVAYRGYGFRGAVGPAVRSE
ncbi:MAG: glycosyltransferase family 39 protein [Armatimonadota bacterium]|nr:glycosyltransferase family 39 protein [Armatimonadota bacterium]MDR7583906.1 glycosyltransferase family 39 protein [Armatimonadota bacterium]